MSLIVMGHLTSELINVLFDFQSLNLVFFRKVFNFYVRVSVFLLPVTTTIQINNSSFTIFKDYNLKNSYFMLFLKVWKFTKAIAFKIVDCIIIHRNPGINIEYFLDLRNEAVTFWCTACLHTPVQCYLTSP